MYVETNRLIIRELQASDAVELARMWADPEVTEFMGGPRDEAQVRQGLEEDAGTQEKFDLWPVVEKESGALVGHCGLLDKEVDGKIEIELVYVLARSAWGKGYATEAGIGLRDYAFAELGLSRLISLIEPENAASERVAVKVGMHHEKDVIRPGGRLMKVYAIERSIDSAAK